MPEINTSIKNISDLLSEKRDFLKKIEDDQWKKWKIRNRDKPKFPQSLFNTSKDELKKIFDPMPLKKLFVKEKPTPEVNVQAIMKRYEKELEEIELPEPKKLHQEFKKNDILLR